MMSDLPPDSIVDEDDGEHFAFLWINVVASPQGAELPSESASLQFAPHWWRHHPSTPINRTALRRELQELAEESFPPTGESAVSVEVRERTDVLSPGGGAGLYGLLEYTVHLGNYALSHLGDAAYAGAVGTGVGALLTKIQERISKALAPPQAERSALAEQEAIRVAVTEIKRRFGVQRHELTTEAIALGGPSVDVVVMKTRDGAHTFTVRIYEDSNRTTKAEVVRT
jgi:transcription termination factor NusB